MTPPSGSPLPGDTTKTALVLSHLCFEDTGTLGELLSERGFVLSTVEPALESLSRVSPDAPALVIVLGGPVGVYEEAAYPHLTAELAFVKARLDCGKPIVGLCLGAQLMARALGATVAPSGLSEIGWEPLWLTPEGRSTSLSLLGDGLPMLHWHGDTFGIPEGLTTLARTARIPNQAFLAGPSALALQFHPEFREEHLERWLLGHAFELAAKGVDLSALRQETRANAPALRIRARAFFDRWLKDNGL